MWKRSLATALRSVSKRTLALFLVAAILLLMIPMTLLMNMSTQPTQAYLNPSSLSKLNHSVVVQEINLLPVDSSATGSRTTLYAGINDEESGKYSKVTVNEDRSVDFTITADNYHNNGNHDSATTSYVEAFTLINQKINIAENPWLMVRWSGSGRCNGRIYFSVTINGTEYGINNTAIAQKTDDSGKKYSSYTELTQDELLGKLYYVPLSNIINNNSAGYSYDNQTQTDFNAGTVADYSIDLYKYLNDQVIMNNNGKDDDGDGVKDENSEGINLDSNKWFTHKDCNWTDSTKNYITVYMSCQIIASEAGQPLKQGTNIHWEKFSLGREVMNRPASMLPRNVEFMNITNDAGNAGVDHGRVSKLDDGTVTFLNTSDTDSVKFTWNLRRYFNATELEALHVNATYSGMTSNQLDLTTWYGGRTTTYIESGSYNYRGTKRDLSSLVNDYATSKNITDPTKTNGTYEAVVDFHSFLMWVNDELQTEGGYSGEYATFYPDDSLIFINDISLTIPAGAKISFTRLEFQVENENIPATQADTVYPWASAESPNGLPPVGTPALSTALNGATGTSYEWVTAAEDAPIVKTKIDLLAMKTYSFNHWDKTPIKESEGDDVGVEYIRNTDGSSVYSSKGQTVNTYYNLMRYGPSEELTRNYYTYIDVKDTPYLYYSYELIDTTTSDNKDPEAGFYFHFANAGRDTYYNQTDNKTKYSDQYYLDHSGIDLNECSSVYSLGDESGAYEYGTKAILSNNTQRTGCIDISSLWVDGISNMNGIANGQYLKLENMRIYLAPGTDIKINYFFIGSGSLSESALGQVPVDGGTAVPWAVSKADFNKWSDPDSPDAKYTYANKVDILADIQDRIDVHNKIVDTNTQYLNNGHPTLDAGNVGSKINTAFPGGTVNADESVTLTVTNNTAGTNVNTGFLQTAGVGFDHTFKIQTAQNDDYSSMRYLNYSVDAPAGMRWSLMFCEANNSTQQRAIMTWCDSDARWNDNTIDTSAPAGKSYFRMATAGNYDFTGTNGKPEYDTYWKNQHNTSWRIYSIPGAQSGCVDLRQVDAEFDWTNIISIYLVAYQDPNVVLGANEEASVTFNYLYLTSTPITKDAIGKPAVNSYTKSDGSVVSVDGMIYNWGNTDMSAKAPTVSTKRNYKAVANIDWGATYVFNYQLADNISVDLNTTPYLYYSYRYINKATGEPVDENGDPLRVSMWIIENNTHYYQRNVAGTDSNNYDYWGYPTTNGSNTGYGKPSYIRFTASNSAEDVGKSSYLPASIKNNSKLTVAGNDSQTYINRGNELYLQEAKHKYFDYYGYACETGCIDLSKYFFDATTAQNLLRFAVDGDLYNPDDGKYELIVDYLFLGSASSTVNNFTYYWEPALEKAPTPADFQEAVLVDKTAVSAGTVAVTKQIDLDKTPYLFYSLDYPAGKTGTFGLTTDKTVDGSTTFFRDSSRTDGILISAGGSPATKNYMLQSETGCIDLRQWYISNNVFKETDSKIINISAVNFWNDGGTMNYLYFGAKADKTIDLIPNVARGRLDNGLPTRTWVVPNGTISCAEIMSSTGEWDVYDTSTLIAANTNKTTPVTKVKFKGDLSSDGFNDLWITSEEWSQIYLRYGNIINKGDENAQTFEYITTGNNQMSGLLIDLNETPYLHFSFEQPANSKTTMLLQTNKCTETASLNGKSAKEVKPWLSAYMPTSPAGQLISIVSDATTKSYYKDMVMDGDGPTSVYGDQGGVIDLRSWYTQTNGYGNVISLDSIRFYTHDNNGNPTEMKIKHLYLGSSASAAYAVTFNKNDGSGLAYTQHVIKNANEQYVSDAAVSHFKERDGYTFVGWYTDSSCEEYFDIQGTPLTGNVHLYARWIKNENIIGTNMSEVSILDNMDFANRVTTGQGYAALDNEKLSISNTGGVDLVVRFPVGKAYSVEQLRALFMGFDTDKTCKAFETEGVSEGFDIILDAKCASSHNYSLIQEAFAADYLTSDGYLTAAPYDRESAIYTYLGVRNDLPTRENEGGLIEINAVTFVVPAGVSVELRYMKAGKELSLLGNSDKRAPATTTSFDLLDNLLEDKVTEDATFVNKSSNVVYTKLDATSLTYQNEKYVQSAFHGIEKGYVHLGGLYNYTINMKQIKSDIDAKKATNEGRYLYFSIDQPEDSYFTFALYTSFSGMVEGNETNVLDVEVRDVYTQKAVSYFSSADNGLVAKDYNDEKDGFIPVETAYINGNYVGKIDLYTWYQDALKPYRSNSRVDAVKLLGVRLFSSDRTTDTTINYMFIGNDETENSKKKYGVFAEPGLYKGAGAKNYENYIWRDNVLSDTFHMLGGDDLQLGETLYVTLDELTNIIDDVPINDPTKRFVGWAFRDIVVSEYAAKYQALDENLEWDPAVNMVKAHIATLNEAQLEAYVADYIVYWNPHATNGNMYHPVDNQGGSWFVKNRKSYSHLDSQIPDNFVQTPKSVFYTFSTNNGNTQIILPCFATTDFTPTVSAVIEGSGTVAVTGGNATAVANQPNMWTTAYGSDIVLTATAAQGNVFLGWFDQNGRMVSESKDYHLNAVVETALTAKFGTIPATENDLIYTPQNGHTIVWLQSTTGVAGTDFYLKAANTGKGTSDQEKISYSNITNTNGNTQIVCYWNLNDAQLVTAVAPAGHHWEMLLSDGKSTVRVSNGTEYSFIVSTNIKLICVSDSNGDTFNTTVIHDEFPYDDDRTNNLLRFNGQVVCGPNEEIVSCGMVYVDFINHGELPSIGCDRSATVTASAWNSTTGQFYVEFPLGKQYVVRSFAIVRDTTTEEECYIRYSDIVSTVF